MLDENEKDFVPNPSLKLCGHGVGYSESKFFDEVEHSRKPFDNTRLRLDLYLGSFIVGVRQQKPKNKTKQKVPTLPMEKQGLLMWRRRWERPYFCTKLN